eukprot:s6568_g2.t1
MVLAPAARLAHFRSLRTRWLVSERLGPRGSWIHGLASSIAAKLDSGERDPPLSDEALLPFLDDLRRFLQVTDDSIWESLLSVQIGQPFRLNLWHCLALICRDPDSDYFQLLRDGVPLGISSPIPPLFPWFPVTASAQSFIASWELLAQCALVILVDALLGPGLKEQSAEDTFRLCLEQTSASSLDNFHKALLEQLSEKDPSTGQPYAHDLWLDLQACWISDRYDYEARSTLVVPEDPHCEEGLGNADSRCKAGATFISAPFVGETCIEKADLQLVECECSTRGLETLGELWRANFDGAS